MSGGPIAQFLGVGAASGGPFALLGVEPASASADAVTAALAERLAVIDAHPHADTPDADEVRLALHASAAQLLDPVMAARARERWGGGSQTNDRERTSSRAPSGAPAPPVRTSQPPARADVRAPAQDAVIPAAFRRDVLLTLAHAGGWKPHMAHRIAQLARLHGLGPEAAVGAVASLGRGRVASVRTGAAAEPTRQRTEPRSPTANAPAASDRGGNVSGLALAFAALVLVVAVAAAVIVLPGALGLRQKTAPDPKPAPIVQSQDPAPTEHVERKPAPEVAVKRDVLAELASAVARLDDDPDAAGEVFASAVELLGRTWGDLDVDRRRAANGAVTEYLFRAARRAGAGPPAVRAIAAPARNLAGSADTDVWAAAWSVGVLSRLVGERNLLVSMSQEVDLALASALGDAAPTRPLGAFDSGVLLALDAMIPRLTPPIDSPETREEAKRVLAAWEKWGEALDAAAGASDRLATRGRLAAIDHLLVWGPEPASSETLRGVVRGLVLGCEWGEDSPARRWVTRALVDPRYSTDDLHALTLPLVTASSARGVDPSMVVRRESSETDRRAIAERYSAAWGLADRDTNDAIADAWRQALERWSSPIVGEATRDRQAQRAAALAHLNASAAWRWRGELERAETSLARAESLGELSGSGAATPGVWLLRGAEVGAGRGQWATRYLQAGRDPAARLELLGERNAGPIDDAIDAEVIAREAVRGSPGTVRAAAITALQASGGTVSVLNALLELAPTMPRTPGASELVADMTLTPRLAADDPEWRLKVRRRLVAAILERMAGDAIGGVDEMAKEIADAYMERADAAGERLSADASDPRRAAALARARWRSLAAAGGGDADLSARLARIDRRGAARRELAVGPIQRFAAEQVTAVECMALALIAERPERAPAVDGVLNTLARERRETSDIIEQVLAAELAAARLWALRFDSGGAS